MPDLLSRDVVSSLHVSDQIVSPGAVVNTPGTFEGSHPVMYPHVKAESEGRVECFATFLASVSHISTVSSQAIVKPTPEPVAFSTDRTGVELLS